MNRIRYYADIQKDAVASIARLVRSGNDSNAKKIADQYGKEIDAFAKMMLDHFKSEVQAKAKAQSLKLTLKAPAGEWEKEAAKIVPKRKVVGTLTLEGSSRYFTRNPSGWTAAAEIPVLEREVARSVAQHIDELMPGTSEPQEPNQPLGGAAAQYSP